MKRSSCVFIKALPDATFWFINCFQSCFSNTKQLMIQSSEHDVILESGRQRKYQNLYLNTKHGNIKLCFFMKARRESVLLMIILFMQCEKKAQDSPENYAVQIDFTLEEKCLLHAMLFAVRLLYQFSRYAFEEHVCLRHPCTILE